MVAQSSEKGTGNESEVQDIAVSFPIESETLHSETTKGHLNSELIYEVIASPKMQT